MNIDHINISAPLDLLEEVKTFYCHVFDMKSSYRPGFSKKGFWLYSGTRPLVHLSESNEHFKYEGQGCLDHIAFAVDDLDLVMDKLTGLGVDFSTSGVTEIGLSQIFFKDPSGTGIEVNTA